MTVLAAFVAAVVAAILAGGGPAAPSVAPTEGTAQPLQIVVPEAEAGPVVADGELSAGEWEGAFQQRVSKSCDLYLLADSTHLYVGFRFLRQVEADFVAEVYLAANDDGFLNLHSSAALGEAFNPFSPDLRRATFAVDRNTGWESNVTGIGARSQGKEFRISRAILPGPTVRAAGSMIVVNETMRETASFPARFGFANADDWVELVLPAASEPEEDQPPGGESTRE